MRVWMKGGLFESVFVQQSLLDVAGEPTPRQLGASVRRVSLSQGAWVDLRPGWLADSGAVLARLAEAVPWRAERGHRYDRVDLPLLLCFYGEDEPLPDPVLTAARQTLNAHYGAELGEPFRTRGALPLPGRAGQRGLARRHRRAQPPRGHHGRDLVAGYAAGVPAAAARRRLPAHLGARHLPR